VTEGLDEGVLGDEAQLDRRDQGRLLWSLARTGAHVRRAGEVIAEFGPGQLHGDRPRAVLLVGDPPARGALRVLTRLLAPAVPVTIWSGADLPRWAGPADALLAAAVDGRQPRVTGLVEQAARRGLIRAVVAPAGSPVWQAAGRAPAAALPAEVHVRAALWALTIPLLQAADALQLWTFTPTLLAELADGLDASAEACRPGGDVFTNPAKSLALDFSTALPLLVGAGPLAGIAARIVSDALRLYAGSPAIAVTLPDGVAVAAALIAGTGGSSPDDLFRDRVEEAVVRPRMVVIGDDGEPDDPLSGPRSSSELQLDERAARRASAALHELAAASGVRSSAFDLVVDPRVAAPLTRLAAVSTTGMFAASYLALASGLDPSAPRPGEIA
jgi:glucose/mannose-6-phosphate isomerase